jgi:regulatory protein
MVSSRVSKGVGEQLIQRELADHEISQELIEAAFSEQDHELYELALQVYVKKYGQKAHKDRHEQQKRNRFLPYRGFSHEQIRSVYPSLQTYLCV